MKRIIIFLICSFTFVLCWSKNNVSILTQSTVDKKKGIFIINQHYDLDGKTIVFPKGLVIKFRKGKIDNGVIVGTNTKIQIDKNACVFGKNISIQGSWSVNEIYDKWFEFDSNPNFVAKAPASLIESEKSKLLKNKELQKSIEEKINNLK